MQMTQLAYVFILALCAMVHPCLQLYGTNYIAFEFVRVVFSILTLRRLNPEISSIHRHFTDTPIINPKSF
jgi:hypothetical protein